MASQHFIHFSLFFLKNYHERPEFFRTYGAEKRQQLVWNGAVVISCLTLEEGHLILSRGTRSCVVRLHAWPLWHRLEFSLYHLIFLSWVGMDISVHRASVSLIKKDHQAGLVAPKGVLGGVMAGYHGRKLHV